MVYSVQVNLLSVKRYKTMAEAKASVQGKEKWVIKIFSGGKCIAKILRGSYAVYARKVELEKVR